LDDCKDLKEMEEPVPAKTSRDLPANNRRQGGRGVENEGNGRNSQTTLVNKEDITDRGNDQRFVGRCGETLDNSSRKQQFVCIRSLTDRISNNHENSGCKENRTFPPFS
jgi:hypothetical protein